MKITLSKAEVERAVQVYMAKKTGVKPEALTVHVSCRGNAQVCRAPIPTLTDAVVRSGDSIVPEAAP